MTSEGELGCWPFVFTTLNKTEVPMPTHSPGVRFSIRPEGAVWLWRAMLSGVVLAEGTAATRAIAAAHVIRIICRVCGPDAGAIHLAKAA